MAEKRLTGLPGGPANNTTMEPEMNALCAELAPFLVAGGATAGADAARDDLRGYRDSTPTLRVVPELHARLSIPVWSSISATAWAGTRMMARERV
jgi:maleate cis-trans isomerase